MKAALRNAKIVRAKTLRPHGETPSIDPFTGQSRMIKTNRHRGDPQPRTCYGEAEVIEVAQPISKRELHRRRSNAQKLKESGL